MSNSRNSSNRKRVLGLETLESRTMMNADTMATAIQVGSLTGSRSYYDTVSATDANDYYRFSIQSRSNVSLSLTGMRANADLQLLDVQGRSMTRVANAGAQNEAISRTLNPGTYYIRVFHSSGQTPYRLTLAASRIGPIDAAGNTLAAARDLGTLNGARTFSDFVGHSDMSDYYRFALNQRSVFRLALQGLSADADVQLLGSNGSELTRSALGGSSPESIVRTLEAGTYFVRVYPYGNANTNYSLNLAITPSTPPDDVPNDFDRAVAINLSSNGAATREGSIEQARDVDMFRFTATTTGTMTIQQQAVNGSRLDSYMFVYGDNRRQIKSDDDSAGMLNSRVAFTVVAGQTYFVKAAGFGSSTGAYALQLSSVPAVTEIIEDRSPLPGFAERINVRISRVGDQQTIESGRATWLVIHGRCSSPNHENISRLAQAIVGCRPGDQVLVLDWSQGARDNSDGLISFEGSRWISQVANWAATQLTLLGLAPEQINLVGHSWGALMSGEIARNLHDSTGSRIQSLVALDPAQTFLGYYNGDVDFNRDAVRSWGFDSSALGRDAYVNTADESFNVLNLGIDPRIAHSAIVGFFASMVMDSRLGRQSNDVSRHFSLSRLTDPNPPPGPWSEVVDGFEAVIRTEAMPPATIAYYTFENDTPLERALNGRFVDALFAGDDPVTYEDSLVINVVL